MRWKSFRERLSSTRWIKMTEAQIKKRNKFLQKKDRMKMKKEIERMEAALGPIPLRPWYDYLPAPLR